MLIFIFLLVLISAPVGFAFVKLHLIDAGKQSDFTASAAFFGELLVFLGLVGAAAVMALIERRRNLLAFNLTGPRRTLNFFSGLAAGFLALSALVGALNWGGWLHFGPVALSGPQIFDLPCWGRCLSAGGLRRGGTLPLLHAIHPHSRHQFLVGAGNSWHGLCEFALEAGPGLGETARLVDAPPRPATRLDRDPPVVGS